MQNYAASSEIHYFEVNKQQWGKGQEQLLGKSLLEKHSVDIKMEKKVIFCENFNWESTDYGSLTFPFDYLYPRSSYSHMQDSDEQQKNMFNT
jgi:hypothetical protein